jgi:hypothetical protein
MNDLEEEIDFAPFKQFMLGNGAKFTERFFEAILAATFVAGGLGQRENQYYDHRTNNQSNRHAFSRFGPGAI